jgi:D-alanyl-D-alanine carboxypeptidase
MTTPLRFGSAASAIVLASMIAGCATPQVKTSFGGKADENVGLATRALAALNSNQIPTAIDFAERAVAQSPDDAGFRALLGNAYFAGGRFRSAESAYKDALTIYSNQPQVLLKLALVETALGKKDAAVAFLQAGRSVLDASNYGLALALAGQPDAAIPVLEAAARQKGADATVRQNLALAHALSGDWPEARTIAAQDVPADKLDARIHEWMQLAKPSNPSQQVAAFIGVTPAAVDQGQPVRLALRKADTMVAEAAPAKAPVMRPAPAPRPQVAEAAPPPVAPKFVKAVAAPAPAPVATPAIAAPSPAPEPVVVAEASSPAPVAMLTAAAEEISEVSTAAAQKLSSVVHAFLPQATPVARPKARHAIAHRRPLGPTDSVVQLGSYRSPQYVAAAWSTLTKRYPALRAYLPLRARFDSANGTYWRLSIQGFGNQREAIARCQQLKSNGGKCFVRTAAGDAPVQIASN